MEIFSNLINELKIFFYLFKKENVFKLLLIIFCLMIISGTIFMFLEYDRVLAANANNANYNLFDKITTIMYWAIVTISTCGYGDIAPYTTAGRILVMVVLYLSVATVSLFTANLASALTTKKMMERRGIMNVAEHSDHYVICGWKNAMDEILSEIKICNPKLDFKNVIIIANIEPDVLELFHQQYPDYQEVTIIRGEHYNETLLKMVNVQKAKKVLILADESSNASPTETDSKTVMTAMTINSISPNCRVCAEILDKKFEKYLKTAHVEEIIYTNEYNKMLIATSFSYVGITKVVNELLDITTSSYFKTVEIPNFYIGKSYLELKSYYKKEDSIIIGLIEHVGNFQQRKTEALRQAQKTADVTKLIENLKVAKKIENNLPNINPNDNYIVLPNSMAILIARSKT